MRRLGPVLAFALVGLTATPVARAQPNERLPYLVRGMGVDVLLVPGDGGLPDSVADARMTRLLRECGDLLPLTENGVLDLVDRRSPSGWPEIPRGAVAVIILPRDGLGIRCGDDAVRTRLAAARGLRLTFDTTFTRDLDVLRTGARVHRDEIAPLATHQGTVQRVTPWGIREVGTGIQRVDLPLEVLAGDSAGLGVGLTLEVAGAVEASPTTVKIPPAVLDSVWTDLFAVRVTDAGLPVALAEGIDPRARSLPREQQRTNDLAAATAFVTAGDSLATRVLLERALRRDPCLALPEAADASLHRIMAPLPRRPVRCEAIPTARIIARGTLLPGFGRPVETLHRPLVNALIVGGIVGGVLAARRDAQGAHEAYDRYVGVQVDLLAPATSATLATRHYARADRLRLSARDMQVAVAGIWIGSVIEAVLRERAFARYLAAVGR